MVLRFTLSIPIMSLYVVQLFQQKEQYSLYSCFRMQKLHHSEKNRA